jgi:hypothetical protein
MKAKRFFNPSRFNDTLDEGLYHDGEKGRELKDERQKLVEWLGKKGKHVPACLALADKIDGCKRRHRCKSPACPECAHAGQRLIARVTRHFLKAKAHDDKIVCVTVVPKDGRIKPGSLDKRAHDRAIRRWKEKLGKAGVQSFVGATDWSFNEHAEARYKPRWSEHFYGVTVTKSVRKLKQKLKKQFPKTDAIPRPVKVLKWDGHKKALRYILKPNFWRRVATDDAQRHDKKTGTTRTCRAIDKQRLRSKHKLELLVHLDEIGMQSRLLFRWCQLINIKGKKPTIVLRVPKAAASKK